MQSNVMIDPIPLTEKPNPQPEPEAGLTRGRRPDWLRVKINQNDEYWKLKRLMRSQTLHTVCEEALCPNLGECWGAARLLSC